MLNEDELQLLDEIAALMRGFKRIQFKVVHHVGGGYDEDSFYDEYDGDFKEVEFHIHALQNMVMANSAAREHSDLRFFGATKKKNEYY